jgi:hypothetical protein
MSPAGTGSDERKNSCGAPGHDMLRNKNSGVIDMELAPLHPDLGVEIGGVGLLDVASSDAAYRAVRAAFEEHSLFSFGIRM